MSSSFVNYRSYNDKAIALSVFERLSAAGLAVKWDDSEKQFDVFFSYNEFSNIYYIKLKQEDFKKADELLQAAILERGEIPEQDYYLYSFTNDELTDILKKPEEWSEFDIVWSKRILEQRGVTVNDEEIAEHRNEILTELRKPWKADKIWILAAIVLLIYGYCFFHIIIIGCAFFMGLYITSSKKTLPGGERVIAFSPTDRLIGKIVMGAALLSFIVFLLRVGGILDFRWF